MIQIVIISLLLVTSGYFISLNLNKNKVINYMEEELYNFTRQALFWNFMSNELIKDSLYCEADHLPLEKYIQYADTEVEKVFTGHPNNIVDEALRDYFEGLDG